MHELSVAQSLIELLTERLADEGVVRVSVVKLAIGQLSGIASEALTSAFHTASQGTLLDGAKLEIESIPARIVCTTCAAEHDLTSIQDLRCPSCGQPSSKLVRGREMQILTMEVFDPEPIDAAKNS